MKKRLVGLMMAIQCLSCVIAAAAFAQKIPIFNANVYESIASPNAPDIPPGTAITRDNWTKYAPYMTIGMQETYGGKLFYHIPPGVSSLVGPTMSIPLPWKYAQDTERYGGQARLVTLSTGGVDITGYVAGVPFPTPAGPNKAMEILYNAYYQYSPFCIHNEFATMIADRYHNISGVVAEVINFRMNHLSDEGMGVALPGRPADMFQTIYDELLAPEQSKYTASIDMQPDDVKKLSELYVFLPSLRRSLRLSAAARCAPVSGTDDTNDDNNAFAGIPTWFAGTYLGDHKILAFVHEHQGTSRMDPASYESVGTDGFQIFWPKPVAGHWELRKVDVIDLTPLATVPMARGYCYGHRVLYIDQEAKIIVASEMYDQNNKLWKIKNLQYSPTSIGDSHGSMYVGPVDATDMVFDIQNDHMDHPYQQMNVQFDNQVPASFRNVERYGKPGGLEQIMQ